MAQYKFDLVQLVQAVVDQVTGSDERMILEQFVDRNSYGHDEDFNPIRVEQFVTVSDEEIEIERVDG